MAPMPAGHVADQLMRYLTGARWFAGKGRQAELHSLTPLPWLSTPRRMAGGPVRSRRSGLPSEILDQ